MDNTSKDTKHRLKKFVVRFLVKIHLRFTGIKKKSPCDIILILFEIGAL